MADENKPVEIDAVVEATTLADVAAPKKRGPRAKKVAPDGTTAEATVAAIAKRGRKRKETSGEVKAASQPTPPAKARAKAVAKGTGKRAAPKLSSEAPAPILDEIADLLRLEEENAQLRKALGEKLRAENADLRKRLGLN